ncbi:hypothetical protein ZOSMA_192G00190 [Zostera marina]|uniref:Uncharacterized protein n=1 Tax=Zostera marina TaxID=29655 RepID=A0A0K9PPE5_ZOSMR|nr:hypothetical protein ZOSMA_192G00190 [Zostera marina]
MEISKNAKIIRLRSHHEKFLAADDDKETVGQERYGSTRRAKWEVEQHGDPNDVVSLVRLKSCYGLYLTASNTPFLLGASGHKVLQTKPQRLDSSIQWELIKEGRQFKLKTRYGNFLRANAGLPPWRNSVTHHIPHRSCTQDWLLWDIDILEFKMNPNYHQLQFERPSMSRSSSLSEASSSSGPILFKQKSSNSLPNSPPRSNGRVIEYYVATTAAHEISDEESRSSLFEFKGSSVEELRHGLEAETGLKDVVVCTRSQLDGKLYPLRLHLPPNNVAMSVVVVPSHIG